MQRASNMAIITRNRSTRPYHGIPPDSGIVLAATMEIFNLKQPRGANKYPKYTAVYSKYTAVYSRVYGSILRYWSLEYRAVYPKSPKWGIFKYNIDHHNWQTRGIPQPTYACIVFVPTCTCHIPLSPKTPFFTRILPGISGMPGYAHHIGNHKKWGAAGGLGALGIRF